MSSHHQKVSDKYVFDVATTDKFIEKLQLYFTKRSEFTSNMTGIIDNILTDIHEISSKQRCARMRKDFLPVKGS